jgi:hypothetical protein
MLSYLALATAPIAFLMNYLKIAPSLPNYGFWKRLQTVHFAPPKHKFYDTTLNPNVGYAKHVISIDENCADFKRVTVRPRPRSRTNETTRQSSLRTGLVSGRARRCRRRLSRE